jgi:hypothetical protein
MPLYVALPLALFFPALATLAHSYFPGPHTLSISLFGLLALVAWHISAWREPLTLIALTLFALLAIQIAPGHLITPTALWALTALLMIGATAQPDSFQDTFRAGGIISVFAAIYSITWLQLPQAQDSSQLWHVHIIASALYLSAPFAWRLFMDSHPQNAVFVAIPATLAFVLGLHGHAHLAALALIGCAPGVFHKAFRFSAVLSVLAIAVGTMAGTVFGGWSTPVPRLPLAIVEGPANTAIVLGLFALIALALWRNKNRSLWARYSLWSLTAVGVLGWMTGTLYGPTWTLFAALLGSALVPPAPASVLISEDPFVQKLWAMKRGKTSVPKKTADRQEPTAPAPTPAVLRKEPPLHAS